MQAAALTRASMWRLILSNHWSPAKCAWNSTTATIDHTALQCRPTGSTGSTAELTLQNMAMEIPLYHQIYSPPISPPCPSCWKQRTMEDRYPQKIDHQTWEYCCWGVVPSVLHIAVKKSHSINQWFWTPPKCLIMLVWSTRQWYFREAENLYVYIQLQNQYPPIPSGNQTWLAGKSRIY